MVVVGIVVGLVIVMRVRYLRKRALVAGLDKPAIWREPAPGRVGDRLKDGLL